MHGKAKSIECEGFEFVKIDLSNFGPVKSHRWLRDKPQWFLDEYEKGNIAPVRNHKHRHVTITNKNASFQCHDGDYIIKNPNGLIFWMPEFLFNESMEIINE